MAAKLSKPELRERVRLTLPLPPTVNRYYGVVPGTQRRYLTKPAKAFRHDVSVAVEQRKLIHRFEQGRLMVHVVLHMSRSGDVDNRNKPLLDALQHAHLFTDDKQVKRLIVDVGHFVRGGRCDVTIEEI